jgi:pyruvate/2-oxoglutarate/acetoin dehydrogenase E1 component
VTVHLTYHQARTRAICRELAGNPHALLVGQSLSLPFNDDDDLPRRFPDQTLTPPYSELATCAAGVGAAIGGLRPLIALSTSSFMFYAWPAIANEAPLVRYLSHGAVSAPVAFHVHGGSRRSGGPQHEHTPQAMLQNIPGLRVLAPGTPADIDAALHEAFTGGDPTVIFDHVLLAETSGPVAEEPPARVAPTLLRRGSQALIICASVMTPRSLQAAVALAGEGLSVAVLNVPVIAPSPISPILEAAREHDTVVFVEESRGAGSAGSFLMAQLLARRRDVRATLVCSAAAPAPFALALLDEIVPTASRIADVARDLIKGAAP